MLILITKTLKQKVTLLKENLLIKRFRETKLFISNILLN